MKYGDKKYNYEAIGAKNTTRQLGYSVKVKTVKGLAAKRAEVQMKREIKESELYKVYG